MPASKPRKKVPPMRLERKILDKKRYLGWLQHRVAMGGAEHAVEKFRQAIRIYKHMEQVLKRYRREGTVDMDAFHAWKKETGIALARGIPKHRLPVKPFSKAYFKEDLGKELYGDVRWFNWRKQLARAGEVSFPMHPLRIANNVAQAALMAVKLTFPFSSRKENVQFDFERPSLYFNELMKLSRHPTRARLREAREELEEALHASQQSQKRLKRSLRHFLGYERAYRKSFGLKPFVEPVYPKKTYTFPL